MGTLGDLDLDEEARFYARLGFEVLHRYDGYVVLGRGDLEIHLAHWDDHDPARTAGVAYLRVSDAQAIYDDLRTPLEREGCLYLAPASGVTPSFCTELERRVPQASRRSGCTRSTTSRGASASSRSST